MRTCFPLQRQETRLHRATHSRQTSLSDTAASGCEEQASVQTASPTHTSAVSGTSPFSIHNILFGRREHMLHSPVEADEQEQILNVDDDHVHSEEALQNIDVLGKGNEDTAHLKLPDRPDQDDVRINRRFSGEVKQRSAD